jgi:hypothetical protein
MRAPLQSSSRKARSNQSDSASSESVQSASSAPVPAAPRAEDEGASARSRRLYARRRRRDDGVLCNK